MAEPAYTYQSSRQAAIGAVEERRAQLKVLSPNRAARQNKPARLQISTLISLALALVIIATAPFAYIWLVNDRMRMMVIGEALEQSIAQGRSAGHRLESEYSGLANSQGIQRQATELGMVYDPNPEYMHIIAGDVDTALTDEPTADTTALTTDTEPNWPDGPAAPDDLPNPKPNRQTAGL